MSGLPDAARRVGLLAAVAAVPVALILLPLGAFLLLSFHRMVEGQIVNDLSLGNYQAFAATPIYWQGFLKTVWLCLRVALIGLVLGYPIAWFIWRRRPRTRQLLLMLTALPLFMSYIVKIYTLRSILGLNGLLNATLMGLGLLEKPSQLFLYNQTAILVTMAVIFLPFVVLPIYLALERIPPPLLAASADLGAGPGATFARVVLPLSLPGTAAGVLFAFVLALGDYITPQMVGGPSGFTYGRLVWSQFGLAYNWPFGSTLAAVLMVFAVGVIALAATLARRQRV